MKHFKMDHFKSTGNAADELKEKAAYNLCRYNWSFIKTGKLFSFKANREVKEAVHLLKEMNNLNI